MLCTVMTLVRFSTQKLKGKFSLSFDIPQCKMHINLIKNSLISMFFTYKKRSRTIYEFKILMYLGSNSSNNLIPCRVGQTNKNICVFTAKSQVNLESQQTYQPLLESSQHLSFLQSYTKSIRKCSTSEYIKMMSSTFLLILYNFGENSITELSLYLGQYI